MTQLRAFLILVAISVMCSVIAVAISVNQIDNNNRKFCDVTSSIVAKPVPSPTDASANPSREQTYEWYERFLTLNRRLGC